MIGGSSSFLVGAIIAKLALDKTGWTQSVKEVTADGQKMAGMSAQTAAAFTKMGMSMVMAGGAIVGAFAKCINAAGEQDKAERQLNAVLESTNQIAGVTAAQALELAESFQKITKYSDEEVLSAENLLLTFTKIGQDIFPEALEAVLDISTALGQDLKHSSIQVGKALQDPILGVTALSRVGVNFDQGARDMIKTLVQQGKTFEAQKFILKELATEFGGSARKAAEGFGGSVKQLGNEMDDLQEEIGKKVTPMLKRMVEDIKPVVEGIIKWIETHPKLTEDIAQFVLKLGMLSVAMGTILILIPKLVALFGVLKIALTSAAGPMGLVAAGLLAIAWGFEQVEKAQDYAIESGRDHIEMQIKLRETLFAAAKQCGMNVYQFNELVASYKDNYTAMNQAILQGKEGVEMQKALEKAHKADYAATMEVIRKRLEEELGLKGLANALKEATEKEKAFEAFLRENAIKTTREKETRIAQLNVFLKTLSEMLKNGEISLRDYERAAKAASDEIEDLKKEAGAAVPPARDLKEVFKLAVPEVETLGFATKTFDDNLKELSDRMGVSEATVKSMCYELARMTLIFAGIKLPIIDWNKFSKASEDTADKAEIDWKDVSDEIQAQWVSMLSALLRDFSNFGEAFNNLAESVLRIATDIFSNAFMNWIKGATSFANVLKGGLAVLVSFVGSKLLGQLGEAFESMFGNARKKAHELNLELEKTRKEALAAWWALTDAARAAGHDWGTELALLSKIMEELAKKTEINFIEQDILNGAWQMAISLAKTLGLEGSEAFHELILRMKELGLQSPILDEYLKQFGEELPRSTTEWERAIESLANALADLAMKESLTEENQKLLDDAWANAIKIAKELGLEGTKAFTELIIKMREAGLESQAFQSYMLGWLDKIPGALTVLIDQIKSLTANIKSTGAEVGSLALVMNNDLDRLGKLAVDVFYSMIANGRSWMEALTAMQEPMEALRKKYQELGAEIPSFLQPMFDMLDKVEKFPRVFEGLDAAMTILKALQNTAYMTQESFDTLVKSATRVASVILEASGSVNSFIKATELTQAQIQQLLPIVSQFVGVAALFGLNVPGWMKTFVKEELGLDWGEFRKTAQAQANASLVIVDKLETMLDRNKTYDEREKDRFDNLRDRLIFAIDRVTDAVNNAFGGSKKGQFGLSAIVPAHTPTLFMAGEGMRAESVNIRPLGGIRGDGVKMSVNFNAPLISTSGLSQADIDRAGERIYQTVKFQLKRLEA